MHTTQTTLASKSYRLADNDLLLLTLLLVVDSLHFVFARLLLPHISPFISAMYVMGIATLQFGLLGLAQGRLSFRVLGQHLGFFLAIGFLVGASTIISYQSVAFIDPGTAALLGKITTLFGLGFGLLWLRERLTAAQVGGALLAIAGVFIITFQPGNYLRIGTLLLTCSTFMYALHAALVKRQGNNVDFFNFFFFRLFCTTAFLLVFAAAIFVVDTIAAGVFPIGRKALIWPGPGVWLLLVLAGTVDVVISRALYYLALRRLQISVHAVVLTVSPVAAILWSLFLFQAIPTGQQLLGGAAVLTGVLVVTLMREL